MTTLNISLPDSMRSFVESRMGRGGYSTASEYIRALIREDQKQEALQALEQKLLDGLDSGPPIEVTEEYMNRKRERLSRKRRKASVKS